MNLLASSLVLYGLIGLGIAVALYLTDTPRSTGERLLRLGTALPFWSFYLPILLARPAIDPATGAEELDRTLAVVERELDAARSTLDEWIGVSREQAQRLQQLSEAWHAQRARLGAMDCLLARPEYALEEDATRTPAVPQVQQSLTARQQNVQRLRQLRRQAEAELLASLAWVRELASRIQLALFSDAPAARAEELLAELASTLETLSAPPDAMTSMHVFKKAE
jgi:hypothetical protein